MALNKSRSTKAWLHVRDKSNGVDDPFVALETFANDRRLTVVGQSRNMWDGNAWQDEILVASSNNAFHVLLIERLEDLGPDIMSIIQFLCALWRGGITVMTLDGNAVYPYF